MPEIQTVKKDSWNYIGITFCYIILSPILLGLLFGNLLSRVFIKRIVTNRIIGKQQLLMSQKIFIIVELILIATFVIVFGYLIYLIVNLSNLSFPSHWIKIGFYILYAVSIAIIFTLISSVPLLIVLSTFKLNSVIENVKSQQIVKIEKDPTKKNKTKAWKTYYVFLTRQQSTHDLIVSLLSKQSDLACSNGTAGVVLNKKLHITIQPEALVRGTVLFGTTGAGKTNTLELFIEYAMQQREHIIIVNGKGDKDLYYDLRAVAENNNYDLKVWSPSLDIDEKYEFIYDPFKNKKENYITAILMAIGRYTLLEETTPGAIYYKNDERACISLLCKILLYYQKIKEDKEYEISLDTLFRYSDLEQLSLLVNGLRKVSEHESKINQLLEEYEYFLNLLNIEKNENLDTVRLSLWNNSSTANQSMPDDFLTSKKDNKTSKSIVVNKLMSEIRRLKTLKHKFKEKESLFIDDQAKSYYEEFIDLTRSKDKTKALQSIRTTFRNLRDISTDKKMIDCSGTSLEEFIRSPKPTILLFSLDTKSLKVQSAEIARMFITDLKQNDYVIREKNSEANLMTILDEFGAFATDDIAELQEQGRSFGFQLVYSIQTLSNLTKVGEDFATRVVGNCSTYITHRTRDNKAAQEVADLVSTNPAFEATERHSSGDATGEQSVREVQQYIHHPRVIKQLADHYALIVTLQDGVVAPIKEPVKIDFADIQNWLTDFNQLNEFDKSNSINDSADNLREEWLAIESKTRKTKKDRERQKNIELMINNTKQLSESEIPIFDSKIIKTQEIENPSFKKNNIKSSIDKAIDSISVIKPKIVDLKYAIWYLGHLSKDGWNQFIIEYWKIIYPHRLDLPPKKWWCYEKRQDFLNKKMVDPDSKIILELLSKLIK